MNITEGYWTYKGVRRKVWRVDARPIGGERRQFKGTKAGKLEAQLWRDKLVRERHAQEFSVLLPDIVFSDFVTMYSDKKSWRTPGYKTRVLQSLALFPHQSKLITKVV